MKYLFPENMEAKPFESGRVAGSSLPERALPPLAMSRQPVGVGESASSPTAEQADHGRADETLQRTEEAFSNH